MYLRPYVNTIKFNSTFYLFSKNAMYVTELTCLILPSNVMTYDIILDLQDVLGFFHKVVSARSLNKNNKKCHMNINLCALLKGYNKNTK